MTLMIIGLLLFLGLHSVRIFADDWRSAAVARIGEPAWKGIYSLFAIAGLALAIIGYGRMRLDPALVWVPPAGLRHFVALLMVPAFILLVAAYVPRNHLKAGLGHPMIIAVALWALAHLLANGRPGDIVFFGAFLLWALLDWRAAVRRPAAAAAAPTWARTAVTVVIGLVAYWLFAFHLHAWVTGVPVM